MTKARDATLAEFAEAGLLAAFGTSEPVRYETNTEPHDHFRCRLCLRLFDLETLTASAQSMPRGFTLERIETRAEGACADCAATSAACSKGVRTIAAVGALPDPLPKGLACLATPGALGTMLLAASPVGLVRLAFDDHGDADELRARAAGRSAAARPLARTSTGQDTSSRATYRPCHRDWLSARLDRPGRPRSRRARGDERRSRTASIAPTRRSAASSPPTR